MTRLRTRPVEDPDQLALIADDLTPLGVGAAERFRAACWAEAQAHDGIVDPNRVRLRLLNRANQLDIEPRKYAALWSTAAAKAGYLDVLTHRLVPISGPGSRGNTNKSVPLRRWREWTSTTT